MKKKIITRALIMAAVFLIVPLILSNQTTFAGDSGCQSGRIAYKYNNYGRQAVAEQQEQFQAAQIRNSQSQPPPPGNVNGGDSEMRSRVSYFASIFFLLGGIWLLIALLRERLQKRYAPKSARRAKVWNFALKPSFALSTFAFLFAAVIIGSVLTSPRAASAQKSEQNEQVNDKGNAINSGLPTHQPIFKAAQQIGGVGVTQIGAPVFDAEGNRYVRGAFSGNLTIGETTLTASFGLDMFIAKYDANLNPVWARQGSGLTTAPSEDLAVEGATAMGVFETGTDGGYLYVAGSFVKTLTLQGGANPPVTLNDNGAAGYNYETFLAKYDLNGNLIWARGGNSGSPKNPDNLETGQNALNKIVFDSFGEPYVAGLISGDNFLGASVSSFICSSNQNCGLHGKSDIIIAKIDKNTGAPTRVHVLGGSDDDNGLDLAVDNVTNPQIPKLYLVGNFSSPQIYLPDAFAGQTYTNTANSINTFVLKFDSDNIQQTTIDGIWAKVLNNDGIIGVNQIATDPQTGQAYITGYYTGTISGSGGGPVGNSITNNRTGTGEAALAGYVASLDTSNGAFFRLASLGGVGAAIAVRPVDGVIFVAGSLWDTGEFVSGGDARTLDSFGGNDLFVAGINRGNFSFDSVKAVAGSGYQGLVAAGNPSAGDGATKNSYSPLGIAFNSNRVFVSGDFSGTLSLDCITLKTSGTSRQAYIAEFLGHGETTTCRIWTNSEPNNRIWDEPSNWNGGIIPEENDSVYVPFRKNAVFNPIYNPSNNVTLSGLSIGDNQTLVLQKNLSVSERLDLLGGRIDAGSNKVSLGPFIESYSAGGGRVLGKAEKLFFGAGSSFIFPVGTTNGYSPVTLSNVNAGKGGTFAVTANQGAYPNIANNLSMNRANRWWNLTSGGVQSADITFQYLPGDITTGTESAYRAYRIPTGGGNASLVNSTINPTAKTVTALNVSQFSDWTLAQPLAPTVATVSVGGRILTAAGAGIPQARVTLIDSSGNERQVITNSFGYYRFDNVAAGAAYIFGVSHKRWATTPITQVLNIPEERNDLDFIVPY